MLCLWYRFEFNRYFSCNREFVNRWTVKNMVRWTRTIYDEYHTVYSDHEETNEILISRKRKSFDSCLILDDDLPKCDSFTSSLLMTGMTSFLH